MKHFALCCATTLALLLAGCSTASRTRADFLKIIHRPEVPLNPATESVSNTNDLVQLKFSIQTEAGQRVPGYLLKRRVLPTRSPAVIALHGTGGSKANMLAFCRKLATNGFIAVTLDARYHGDRVTQGRGLEQYHAAIVSAFNGSGEHPLYYDTVWDVQRLVDYLCTREDVDRKRIGLFGISKGGIETYLTAAVDKRIAATVSCIGVQSFDWALKNGAWETRIRTVQPAFDAVALQPSVTNRGPALVREFYDHVLPGITEKFDGDSMLPLIAPRPLLVINSDDDPHTPLQGVLQCVQAAIQSYQRKNAEDRFAFLLQEKTRHQLKPESERAAIEWFSKWLRPAPVHE
jgi:dienelactone hydrolase